MPGEGVNVPSAGKCRACYVWHRHPALHAHIHDDRCAQNCGHARLNNLQMTCKCHLPPPRTAGLCSRRMGNTRCCRSKKCSRPASSESHVSASVVLANECMLTLQGLSSQTVCCGLHARSRPNTFNGCCQIRMPEYAADLARLALCHALCVRIRHLLALLADLLALLIKGLILACAGHSVALR